jgi:hypothetical protein
VCVRFINSLTDLFLKHLSARTRELANPPTSSASASSESESPSSARRRTGRPTAAADRQVTLSLSHSVFSFSERAKLGKIE